MTKIFRLLKMCVLSHQKKKNLKKIYCWRKETAKCSEKN